MTKHLFCFQSLEFADKSAFFDLLRTIQKTKDYKLAKNVIYLSDFVTHRIR